MMFGHPLMLLGAVTLLLLALPALQRAVWAHAVGRQGRAFFEATRAGLCLAAAILLVLLVLLARRSA